MNLYKKEKKQILDSLVSNNRIKIINCLVELAGDELTTVNECIKLSKYSKKKLRLDLLNLYDYFDNLD